MDWQSKRHIEIKDKMKCIEKVLGKADIIGGIDHLELGLVDSYHDVLDD